MDDLSRRLVPDELWALVQPLIPAHGVRAQGGGPARVDDRAVFTAIVFVLTKLHADTAYDQAELRSGVRQPGIAVRIARKGTETSQKRGTHLWGSKSRSPALSSSFMPRVRTR